MGVGNCLLGKKNRVQAMEYYKQALALENKFYGVNTIETTTVMSNIGVLLMRSGALDEAEEMYDKCVGIMKQYYGEEHVKLASMLFNQADLNIRRENWKKASVFASEALR